MPSSHEIKFSKSLRFTITIVYSMVLFIFSALFVLSINLYLDHYFRREPEYNGPWVFMIGPARENFFTDLTVEERQTIRQVRLQDLMTIQTVSIISLFPLALGSFVLGYYLSGRLLSPLKLLQNKINSLKEDDLGSQIDIDTEDEIGSLAKSFNEMSSRLKQAFDLQAQFVQDASHELRTPLTVMQTNLDTIYDDKHASREELREAIKSSLRGMKDLRSLTETLLNLSIPEHLKLEKHDLKLIVRETLKKITPLAKANKVKISFEKDKKEYFSVVDQELISRAVFNILDNAVKYTITVKAPEVKVVLSTKDGFNVIMVQDNGPGIPENAQEKVFERFFRLDKSRNKKKGGFGLGLAITKRIVDEHQGRLELVSKPGSTTFSIFLKSAQIS